MPLVTQLSLDFPQFSLKLALTLPTQGITAIFGASGSGKSSFLRAIAGLEPRVKGVVNIKETVWQDTDKGINLPPHRRALGYVFQDAALFPHLSVRENLLFGYRRAPRQSPPINLDEACTLFNLHALLDRKPEYLSGGEKSRVAIARAVLSDPELLLMDEPLASLDEAHKEEILPFIEKLRDVRDIPILYVSHAPDEITRLADHLVVLSHGKVVLSAPLDSALREISPPVFGGKETGVVLHAKIAEHDPEFHLSCARFPGGQLWIGDNGLSIGAPLRIRILARDVSLSREPHPDLSILNTLACTVDAIADDAHPALLLTRLRVGETPIIARLTRRSAQKLSLSVGDTLWAQIKTVALVR